MLGSRPPQARAKGAAVRLRCAPRGGHEEASVSHEVSIQDLMRFFDCELSESERWTVGRQVTPSQRLKDKMIFWEAVLSNRWLLHVDARQGGLR
jgi:hypothetical protein